MPTTLIVADASANLKPEIIRQYSIIVVPRQARVGSSLQIIDAAHPLSALLRATQSRQKIRLELPQTAAFLSTIRASGRKGRAALAILPPESVDSSYENVLAVKGLLAGECEIRLARALTTGMGIEFLIESAAAFAHSSQAGVEEVEAFVDRLQSEMKCYLHISDKGTVPIQPIPTGLDAWLTRIFGRDAWAQFNSEGTIKRLSAKAESPLKGLSERRRALVDFYPASHRLLPRFQSFAENPEMGALRRFPALPDRMSKVSSLLAITYVPSASEVKRIADWVRRWGSSKLEQA